MRVSSLRRGDYARFLGSNAILLAESRFLMQLDKSSRSKTPFKKTRKVPLSEVEPYTSFKERLICLMAREGIKTQYALAKEISVDFRVVNHWFHGRAKIPSVKNLKKLAERFGVSSSWLRYGAEDVGGPLPGRPARRIPVLSSIPASFPQEVADEYVEEHLYLPDLPLDSFALIIKDDAMAPTLRVNDYSIFIALSGSPVSGKIVVVTNDYGDPMVRRFRIKGGRPLLESDNEEYPAIVMSKKFNIVGVVVDAWSRRKL